MFTLTHALQENAVASDKFSWNQDILHVRQARPHIGARPQILTHSMQSSQSCITESDDGSTDLDQT